ncbi:hypothetical protein DFH06DRAFT_479688 [Mycena polygramma]|nr:hypothetical protein DFH06DRAFT_699163 [Mycena polygramma]KAJ7631661.1 hypothetical protein DFH06DRAFT_699201 [Mycena polygramma]KAJ7655565.1 hypothetical protein DFH06DRAFT_479688 [Mycena polygramma]
MHQIIYTGASLNPEDEAWIIEQGLPATILYATTRKALCLVSDLHDPEALPTICVVPVVQCEFIPNSSRLQSLRGTSKAGFPAGNYMAFLFQHRHQIALILASETDRTGKFRVICTCSRRFKCYYAFRGRNDN